MKLPQDPKERIKILILIGIGTVAVIFTLVSVVVKPLLARKAKYRSDITKAREELEAAQRDFAKMLRDRDADTKTLERIVVDVHQQGYILQPRLGNYELGARELVEGVAATVGLTLESAREIGVTQIPLPAHTPTDPALRCYTLRVTLNAGLHDVIRFLEAAEDANPYLSVSSLSVTPRTEDPARHLVSVEMQLPVWADPTMGQQLERQLEESRAFVPPERPST